MNRVFVIDDEPAMGENIQRMLQSRDIVVISIHEPEAGARTGAGPPSRPAAAGYQDAGDVGRGGFRPAASKPTPKYQSSS